MLIFLLLFSMLRSLQGAPTTPPSFTSAGDALSLIARGDPPTPDGDGQNMRTRFSIVQSCLLTIFACVWTAIHPNINGPRDSWWTCFKRKVVTTLLALIAPELILVWALEQRISARKIMDKYNDEFAKIDGRPKSLKDWVFHCFKPLPEPWGDSSRWSMTHGFFIQMGGFLLFQNGAPIEVLDYGRLAELLRKKAIDKPATTERELQDRSKGDVISKGIVVWQTTWFALQCCARLAQHLPLSELEVVTLAFTVVNVAIYAAWWDKPQSVDTAIRLHLKELGKDGDRTETALTSDEVPEDNIETNSDVERQSTELSHSTNSANSAESQKLMDESTSEVRPSTAGSDDVQPNISDTRPLMAEDKQDEKGSWLRRKLSKDRHNHGLPVFLIFRLPYRIAGVVRHYTLSKVGRPKGFDGKRLRVPMFYAAGNSSRTARYSLAAISLIFGGIHFIAWRSEFPSRPDQVLWRCAAIALIAFPSCYFLLVITSDEEGKDRQFESKVVQSLQWHLIVLYLVTGLCFFLSLLLYIPARLVVIILALKAIRNPPPAILQDVSWTSFIPHL